MASSPEHGGLPSGVDGAAVLTTTSCRRPKVLNSRYARAMGASVSTVFMCALM
jgi:hypothetical protein